MVSISSIVYALVVVSGRWHAILHLGHCAIDFGQTVRKIQYSPFPTVHSLTHTHTHCGAHRRPNGSCAVCRASTERNINSIFDWHFNRDDIFFCFAASIFAILFSIFDERQACESCGDNYCNIFVDIVDCIGNGIAEIQLFTESVRAAGIVWIFVRETMDPTGTVCHGYGNHLILKLFASRLCRGTFRFMRACVHFHNFTLKQWHCFSVGRWTDHIIHLTGMAAGYVLNRFKSPPKVSPFINLILWAMSLCIMFLLVFGVWNGILNPTWTAIYVSLGHTGRQNGI